MDSGKRNNGKRYSLEYKMEALAILKHNNFNYITTASQLGIAKRSIYLWQQRYGGEITNAVKKNTAERQDGLIDMIYDVKLMILDRMKVIIQDESNLDNLQKTLKTLSEIDGTLNPSEDVGAKSSEVNTYEQINNILIQQG